MLVLPQVAGFVASRWWRRSFTWPLAALATFCVAWYAFAWAPASAEAAHRLALHHCACGMWAVVAGAMLIAGAATHVAGGSLFTWLDRRAHRVFDRPTDGPG